MPGIEQGDGFKVGLFTGVVIVALLIAWTIALVFEKYEPPTGIFYGVPIAFHTLGILVPAIICWYIHSRRNEWWDLKPPSLP